MKADDVLVERLASLFELVSNTRYEMTIVSDTSEESSDKLPPPLSLKRGSAQHMITSIVEDFDALVDNF